MKKTLLLLMLAVMTAGQSMAQSFDKGALFYYVKFGTKTAVVNGLVDASATSITVPATVDYKGVTYQVTEIEEDAFKGKSLTSVDMSAATNLTTINSSAFASCYDLAEFKFPASLKYVGRSALSGTSWYDSQPDMVLAGSVLYEYKGTATTVTLPANTTAIADHAFFSNTTITSVDMSAATHLTTIGWGAFSNCTNLSAISIPASVSEVSAEAFNNTPWLSAKTEDMVYINHVAYKYRGSATTLDLAPGTVSISGYAFSDITSLQSVTIPETVTSIGWGAFNGCTGLTSVNIPSSAKKIDGYTFGGCTGLTSVTIPKGVTSIPKSMFDGCTNLTTVSILGDVTFIDGYAFNGCSNLTTINFPATLTSINYDAFENCTKLSDVTFPASVESVDGSAFDGTAWLGNQTGLVYINKIFYRDKSTDASVTIKDGTTTIADDAFQNNTDVQSVVIPNSVSEIGFSAFAGCTGLTSIVLPDAITSLDGTFPGCTGLTSITLPSSLKSLGFYTFGGCTGLTSIVIPASVTEIGEECFIQCSNLTEVFIDSPDASVGEYVFRGCTNLEKVYVLDGTENSDHLTYYAKLFDGNEYMFSLYPYYKKEVTSSKIATLYLPYEVAIPAGMTAYYCTGKTESVLNLSKLTTANIPAKTPVVLQSDAAAFSFIGINSYSDGGGKGGPFEAMGNAVVTPQPSDINETLMGAAADITVGTDKYLTLGESDTQAGTYGFYLYTGETIEANTCYIPYALEGAKGFTLSIDGEATGISNASADAADSATKVIYDLQGRRVSHPQKGIYIVNGKKIAF